MGQSGGNRDIGRIGIIHLALDEIPAQFGVECGFDKLRGSTKRDEIPGARGLLDVQLVGFEPRDDRAVVTGAKSESLAELIGSEPSMVIRRGSVELVAQELLKISLLRIRWFHH